MAEFEYFCDRILSRLRSRDTKYKERKTRVPLSNIFTASDEAFALLMIYNEIDRWDNIPDPATLEVMEVTNRRKWKNTVEKKFCSAKRGSCDGWKDDGKKMYNDLVKKIEKLRKNPDTGSEFEHKLMVKWLIEKKRADGENMNGVSYSTYVEDDKRFNTIDDDFMTETSAYRKMVEEYEAVMKEEKERENNVRTELYVEGEVSGDVKNV